LRRTCDAQALQLREAELLARVTELQASLNHCTQAGSAFETGPRQRNSASASALSELDMRDDPAPAEDGVNRTVRQGELLELRRQLQSVEAASKHATRMLLDAEERAQALFLKATVRPRHRWAKPRSPLR
jgi:hypothetical protein